jgi:hypothetical protein
MNVGGMLIVSKKKSLDHRLGRALVVMTKHEQVGSCDMD